MIDDPLALLIQGVFLLAAGMYPIGFMLGACSACCDECPAECSKCTHYSHLPVESPSMGDARNQRCYEKFDLVTLTAECDTCSGSRTLADVYPDQNDLRATPSGDVFLTDVIQCGGFTTRLIANNIQFFYAVPTSDSCGCPACAIIMRIRLGFLGFERTNFFGRFRTIEISGPFDRCQQAVAEITTFDFLDSVPETFQAIPKEVLNAALGEFSFACDVGDHLFADDVVLKMRLELDMPCECGACCKDGECRENISESYCEDPDNVFDSDPDAGGGTWQGVGTDCDPNPCEEE